MWLISGASSVLHSVMISINFTQDAAGTSSVMSPRMKKYMVSKSI